MSEPGPAIRRQRKERGMSQNVLAREIGCTQPFLCEIETGKRTPSLPMLDRIAAGLDVTAADLLGAEPVVLTEPGCERTPEACGVFTSREAAQAVIDAHDAAVRRALADGASGICHVGDLRIADVPLNPTLAELFADTGNLYLRRYFEPEDGA